MFKVVIRDFNYGGRKKYVGPMTLPVPMAPVVPSFWIELLKSIPSIVTAGTAIYGLKIAKAGLARWNEETVGRRKTELAKQVLAEMYEARSRS